MKVPPGFTGHARDFVKGSVVPDPKVEITPDVKLLTRSDGKTVIYDRRLPLGENAGVYDDADEAELVARKKYAHEIKPRGPAKQSASDDEAFAAMRRAADRGFALHEPAYVVHDLQGPPPPPGVEDLRKGAIIGRCFRCGREGVGVNEECVIDTSHMSNVFRDPVLVREPFVRAKAELEARAAGGVPVHFPPRTVPPGVLTVTNVDAVVGTLSEVARPETLGKAVEYLRSQKSPDAMGNRPSAPLVAIATEDDVTTFVELDDEPPTKPDRPALVADVIDDAIIAYETGPDFRPCPRCDGGICGLDCACACHLNDDIPPLGGE